MDITSLTVVLSVIVVVSASVLIAFNEPPLWVYGLSCVGSFPLSSALLHGPDFTSAVGDGSAAAWALRLAVTSTVTVVLSFFFGKDSRGGAEDDHEPTTNAGPAPAPAPAPAPRPTV